MSISRLVVAGPFRHRFAEGRNKTFLLLHSMRKLKSWKCPFTESLPHQSFIWTFFHSTRRCDVLSKCVARLNLDRGKGEVGRCFAKMLWLNFNNLSLEESSAWRGAVGWMKVSGNWVATGDFEGIYDAAMVAWKNLKSCWKLIALAVGGNRISRIMHWIDVMTIF